MKLIVNAFLALAITTTTVLPAMADSPALMTIRFNKQNIAYQSRLNEVAHQALAIKPTTAFEVVDVTTAGLGPRGQEVAAALAQAGVPAAQVTVSSQAENVSNEEVRIFVR